MYNASIVLQCEYNTRPVIHSCVSLFFTLGIPNVDNYNYGYIGISESHYEGYGTENIT